MYAVIGIGGKQLRVSPGETVHVETIPVEPGTTVAFDQVLMDVALHRCGVTFVLDRAGVTGDDGASHNGMWDLSVLQFVPGLRIAAPRDGTRLRELLNEAVEVDDAPTVVRFPKGPPPEDIEAALRLAASQVFEKTSLDTHRAGLTDLPIFRVPDRVADKSKTWQVRTEKEGPPLMTEEATTL